MSALVPVRLAAALTAPAAAHPSVRSIPVGLARAIHARLGPGPLGLGTAPLVSGIAGAHGGWSVKAPSQSVAARLSPTGLASVSHQGSASVSLKAVSLSTGSISVALSVSSSSLTQGRLIQHLGEVESREQVTSGGLEQQFVIAHPPVQAAKTLTLALSSSQHWRVVLGGSAIEVPGSGLLYAGLRTTDATGRTLPSHFVVDGAGPKIAVDSRGATYPINIDPTWTNSSTPTATLISSDGTNDTDFGYSVDLSADDTTAIVGAYKSNLFGSGDGAAFIFQVAAANDWATTSTPTATLSVNGLNGATSNLNFGYSVALSADGTTALIGAPGGTTSGSAAFIYQVATERSWASSATPKATLADGSGISDGFGDAVALSSNGRTAVIGAPIGSGVALSYAGAAYLFQVASETSWANTATPTATLTNGASVNDDFGYSVALSANGTTALIGSRFAGAAYIFHVASVTAWVSSSTPTATLNNAGVGGQFGYSVALSGDGTTALVGAPTANVTNAVGAAYVFQSAAGNVWASSPIPIATLTNSVAVAGEFGYSVAISTDGTTALVGAYGVNSKKGAAYVFHVASESTWSSNETPSPTATLTNGNGAPNDSFGSSLTLSPDGTTGLLSAFGLGGNSDITGSAFVDQASSEGAWSSSSSPVATISAAGNPSGSDMGYAVSVSSDGTTALVGDGTPYSDAAGGVINTVYVFHSSSEGTWSSSAASVATLANGVAGDVEFGTSLALSADGTTAFLGDIAVNSNSGAVYVYHVSSENGWTSSAPLVATLSVASETGDSFGWGIALSANGTTALIGNGLYGSVNDSCQLAVVGDAYLFHVSSESDWASSSTPTATLADGGSVGDCFGSAVALSADGTTALIGAFGAGGQVGDAYIFHSSSQSHWTSGSTPSATLTDSAAGWFGWSVVLSADGTMALIGAPATKAGSLAFTGSAYVFHATSESGWTSSASPTATLTDGGPSYYGTFGWSVAVSGDGTTALISGNGSAVAGGEGSVFTFTASSESAWSSSAAPASTFFNSHTSGASFGWAIALSNDGTTAVIGAYSGSTGGAFIYRNTSATVSTPNGSGTMTVSPTSVVAGSTTNTLTFAYTASGGALNDGSIDIAVPTGWSPASLPVTNVTGPSAGYLTSNCGLLAVGNVVGDGLGDTIELTGVTLANGATCTVTYGTSISGLKTTATAPSSPTTSTFTASTASTSTGTLTNIASSPTESVKSSTQVITMAAAGYTTLSKSGTYNVGATTNDTDPSPVIAYSVSSSALDSAGCSVVASGNVSFASTGVCTIDANSGATANFVPASQVQQVINVYVVIPTDTVTFNSEGGSAVANMSGPNGSTIALPTPTQSGFGFVGWTTLPPGEGGAILTSPYTLTSSVTLYAQWTQVIENISFNSEGGSAVSGYSGYYGSMITLPDAPTRAGYTFNGWYVAPSGGTALTSPYTVRSSVTLYAQWTVTALTDTITFNSEGGSAVANMSGPNGSTITLPIAPTRAGYTFNGWYVAPSGGTALTSPYTLTASVTLYAQWTASAPTGPGPYSPLAPVRICDTRAGNPSNLTGAAAQCNSSPLAPGTTRTINVANASNGGLGSFGVPADATAVVLNVTAAGSTGTGYVTVFPTGATKPGTSNLNYTAGSALPNLVEVGLGTSGDVSLYSSNQTDLVVDVEGYTAPTAEGGTGAGLYNPLASPTRICDTRTGVAPSNQCTGRTLGIAGSINVAVTGPDGIPAGATAAVLNVTAANPAAQGYLTVYPQGATKPTASNVNFVASKVSSNRVIVPLSSSGAITVYSSQSVDVLVDVSGYYTAAGGTGAEFTAEAAPVRICDTRAVSSTNACTGHTIGSAGTLNLQVTGTAGVPSNATAVVVNLTGINPTLQTFLSVFPALPRPNVSDLNPAPGAVRANLVVATLSRTGTISIYNNTGSIDVIVDVLGWYS